MPCRFLTVQIKVCSVSSVTMMVAEFFFGENAKAAVNTAAFATRKEERKNEKGRKIKFI